MILQSSLKRQKIVLFKEAENRMLTHWLQFSVKVKHKLIIASVRDESLGESDFFFLRIS